MPFGGSIPPLLTNTNLTNMKTNYVLGLRMLLRGHKYLAVSFYRTVMAHKALTAFIVSLLLNIGLFFSLIEARTERDRINHHATMVELINDSLENKSIRYR